LVRDYRPFDPAPCAGASEEPEAVAPLAPVEAEDEEDDEGENAAFTRWNADANGFVDFACVLEPCVPEDCADDAAAGCVACAVCAPAGPAGAVVLALGCGAPVVAHAGHPNPTHGPVFRHAHPVALSAIAPKIMIFRSFFIVCPLHRAADLDGGLSSCHHRGTQPTLQLTGH
jgi:hypothetical protein